MLDTKIVVGLEAGVEKVRLDLDAETRHRVSRDAYALSRIDFLARESDAKAARQAEIDQEMRKELTELDQSLTRLEAAFDCTTQQIEARLESTTHRLEANIDHTTQKLQAHFENTTQKLEVHVDKTALKLEASFDNTKHRLEADLQGTSQRLETIFGGTTQKLELALTTTTQRLEADLGKMKQGIQSALDMTKETFGTAIEVTERDIVACKKELDVLKKLVESEVDARKAGGEAMCRVMREIHELQESVRKEVHGRQADQDELKHCVTRLEDVSVARLVMKVEEVQAQVKEANVQCKQFQQQFSSQDLDGEIRRAFLKLSNRVQDLESTVASQFRTLELSIDGHRNAHTEAQARLERRYVELTADVDRVGAARAVLSQDLDQQLRQLRQAIDTQMEAGLLSLRNVMSERIEAARAARESLREELSKEHVAREGQLQAELAKQQATQQNHHDQLWQRLGALERRHEEFLGAGRGFEADRTAALERLVQESVARERAARESALEQLLMQERHSRTAHMDQLTTLDTRLAALRTHLDEMGEKQWAELAAKFREWQGTYCSTDEFGRQVRELREMLRQLEGRVAEEVVMSRKARADILEELRGRLGSVEEFVQNMTSIATRFGSGNRWTSGGGPPAALADAG